MVTVSIGLSRTSSARRCPHAWWPTLYLITFPPSSTLDDDELEVLSWDRQHPAQQFAFIAKVPSLSCIPPGYYFINLSDHLRTWKGPPESLILRQAAMKSGMALTRRGLSVRSLTHRLTPLGCRAYHDESFGFRKAREYDFPDCTLSICPSWIHSWIVLLRADTDVQISNRAKNSPLLRYVDSMRTHGHRAARIDPLDLIHREEVAALFPERYGLNNDDNVYDVNGIIWTKRVGEADDGEELWSLRQIREHLRKVYVGNIAYEVILSSLISFPWLMLVEVHAFALENGAIVVISLSRIPVSAVSRGYPLGSNGYYQKEADTWIIGTQWSLWQLPATQIPQSETRTLIVYSIIKLD